MQTAFIHGYMLEGIGESVMSLDNGLINKYRSIYAYMLLISTIKYFFRIIQL